MTRPFLSARWSNLCLISFLVPRDLLTPLLPRGLELDAPPGTPDGMGAVSLVAFDFLDTRVRGVRWPGHINFPEVNLRFYARLGAAGSDPERRGVVFIRELVPRRAIASIARLIYNEPYSCLAMRSVTRQTGETLSVEHEIRSPGGKGGRLSRIRLRAARRASIPPEDSLEHWFKEHQWGFGRDRRGEPLIYEVRHPVWSVHRVLDISLDVDWVGLYGEQWRVLSDAAPISTVLATGSAIEVHPKRNLKGRPAPATPRGSPA